jgi:hypothetical protein
MSAEDLAKKKHMLEEYIETAVNTLVGQFKIDTGFTPNSIDIEMVDATGGSQESHDYVVGSVKVEIKI